MHFFTLVCVCVCVCVCVFIAEPARPMMPSSVILWVLTVLEEVKETQRLHGSMLQSLLRKINEQQEIVELPREVNLPMSTLEEFDGLED